MRWIAALLMAFTLLMVNDFFPGRFMTLKIPGWLIPGTIFLLFVSIGFFSDPAKEEERALKWGIAASFYLPFLIVALNLLGGRSASGIALDDPIVWTLIALSFYEMYNWFKKGEENEQSATKEEM